MNTFLARIGPGILLGLVAWPVLAGDHSYTYYDIGVFGCLEDPFTVATDLTDTGVVTGYSSTPDCTTGHAFTWANGLMTDLDEYYEEGIFFGVQAISQTRVILGAGDPDKVLVRIGDGMVFPLPVPRECEMQSNSRGINDTGTMAVGQCDTNGSGVFAPALYLIDEGMSLALEMLPGLPDDADAEATGVNDDGVVVGKVLSGEQRSFYWIDGELTEIPNLLGGEGVIANAINNHGLIVGLAGTADDFPAMSYDLNTEKMTVLGPGSPEDVNDRAMAVGRDIIDFIAVHAILYEDGEAIDLSAFFPPPLADDSRPNAINNYGWIVGSAEEWGNGPLHGWLLVPEYAKGDYDGDTDVDYQDFQHFQRCFAAEPYIDGTLHVGCSVFDFDDDVDLDLDDYAAFQSAFTGPTAPNTNPNGPG